MRRGRKQLRPLLVPFSSPSRLGSPGSATAGVVGVRPTPCPVRVALWHFPFLPPSDFHRKLFRVRPPAPESRRKGVRVGNGALAAEGDSTVAWSMGREGRPAGSAAGCRFPFAPSRAGSVTPPGPGRAIPAGASEAFTSNPDGDRGGGRGSRHTKGGPRTLGLGLSPP